MRCKLSVNVNKIALLRNARGSNRPSVVDAARVALDNGADGITVHPRPDGRHIRPHDVEDLARLLATSYPHAEFNIEGNPFAPANADGYPGLLALIEATRPAQATLVPDGDDQLTSDHGFRPDDDHNRLAATVAAVQALGARVSLFLDAEVPLVAGVARVGADRVELYTGPYAEHYAQRPNDAAVTAPYVETAAAAVAAKLGINAGHDLDLTNLRALACAIPALAEVSIGHALVADALDMGLAAAVRAYVETLESADPGD